MKNILLYHRPEHLQKRQTRMGMRRIQRILSFHFLRIDTPFLFHLLLILFLLQFRTIIQWVGIHGKFQGMVQTQFMYQSMGNPFYD
ncbi:hypothetical protein MDV008.8 [Gallid alphaherpesvirus 2]|uniref:Uncharacterized protein n=1 Tax=Gallid alphaherpesvirus 2 TaxID=10390 RepID=Q19BG2_9ALPH|nr:hypothetical protein MDV008.8 [Gallid alphaherpesvirus 2]ACF49675.1 hypothetical protein MDV008.8 [synthetic construct]ABR13067.1 hypothetical protein MDV008.8 [Gallid alphaherpesvirus 2]ACF94963.1 hypothetical protein MDV008.8 [Gallid alphaherpesvirus 2]ACR02858.1 hypothetical protein MDV008.8 [synthetic construct]